jgi:hypothetical protein
MPKQIDRLRGPFGAETDAEAISLMQEAADEIERLREALEKIKFRNHPGTTNHELAKEALSRTSEEA